MKTRYALICACALAIAGACTGELEDDTAPQRSAHALEYDGETLYRGFFFREGPAADVFEKALSTLDEAGEIAKVVREAEEGKSEQELAEIRKQRELAVDHLVAVLLKEDPQHFDGFAKAVYGGDRNALAERLDQESALIKRQASTGFGDDLKNGNVQGFIDWSVAMQTYVIYNYVLVYDTVKAWHYLLDPDDDKAALRQELVVDAIATYFAR